MSNELLFNRSKMKRELKKGKQIIKVSSNGSLSNSNFDEFLGVEDIKNRPTESFQTF